MKKQQQRNAILSISPPVISQRCPSKHMNGKKLGFVGDIEVNIIQRKKKKEKEKFSLKISPA